MLQKKYPYITTPQGELNRIAEKFAVARQTVYRALRYQTFSNVADEIRKEALKSHCGRIIRKPIV